MQVINKLWFLGILLQVTVGCSGTISNEGEETGLESGQIHSRALMAELHEMVDFRLEINEIFYLRAMGVDSIDNQLIFEVHWSSSGLISLCDTLIDQLIEVESEFLNGTDVSNRMQDISRNQEFWAGSELVSDVSDPQGQMETRRRRLLAGIRGNVNLVGKALKEICKEDKILLNPYYPVEENHHPHITSKDGRTWESMHFGNATILESLIYLRICQLRVSLLEFDFYTKAPCIFQSVEE